MEAKTIDMDSMITFPTTTEAFIAVQEAGAGRPANAPERKIMEMSVEILNECFDSGKAGEKMPWAESAESIIDTLRENNMLEEFEKDPFLVRYAAFMLTWTKDAYQQGQEAAQHE